MLAASASLGRLRGQANAAPIDLCIRTVRPSLLDLRFSGDPWIVDRGSGLFAICLGNYPLAWMDGLPFDLPSLNRQFHGLRHRRPRPRRPDKVRFMRIPLADAVP